MLHTAYKSSEIDREQWNVKNERQKVLSYHFYDLDKEDQERCVLYSKSISYCKRKLNHLLDDGQLKPVKNVEKHLQSFSKQASQLHGESKHPWTGPGIPVAEWPSFNA